MSEEVRNVLKRITASKVELLQKNKARERVFREGKIFVPILNSIPDEEFDQYLDSLPGSSLIFSFLNLYSFIY